MLQVFFGSLRQTGNSVQGLTRPSPCDNWGRRTETMDGCVGFCGVKIFKRMDTQMRSLHSAFIGLTKEKVPVRQNKQTKPKAIPVVMTTPASTFRRACGDVKFSVSSLNLSTTRRDTASARTCGGNKVLARWWIRCRDRRLRKGPCHKQAPFERRSAGDAN